jgi:hypothetical protein
LAPDVPPKDGKQIHREASSFHTGKFEQWRSLSFRYMSNSSRQWHCALLSQP